MFRQLQYMIINNKILKRIWLNGIRVRIHPTYKVNALQKYFNKGIKSRLIHNLTRERTSLYKIIKQNSYFLVALDL